MVHKYKFIKLKKCTVDQFLNNTAFKLRNYNMLQFFAQIFVLVKKANKVGNNFSLTQISAFTVKA
jgi:hypothetical protein